MKDRGFHVMVFCIVVIWAPLAAMGEEKSWSAEVRVFPGHNNNFFSRGEERTGVGTDLLTVYGEGEIEHEVGKGTVEAFLRAQPIFALDIDDADHQRFTLGTEYKRHRNRISGEVFTNPDRLALFEFQDRAVFYDIQGYEIGVRRILRPGVWVEVEYEAESWDYEEIEDQRDADKESVGATVRFPLARRLGVRASLFQDTKDATAPDLDWDGVGFSVRLDSRPYEELGLSFRYKRSDREYEDAPEDDRNFMREDTIEVFTVGVRWSLGNRWLTRNRLLAGERWGLQVQDRYRTGDSTRRDRNFSSNLIQAGFYIEF